MSNPTKVLGIALLLFSLSGCGTSPSQPEATQSSNSVASDVQALCEIANEVLDEDKDCSKYEPGRITDEKPECRTPSIAESIVDFEPFSISGTAEFRSQYFDQVPVAITIPDNLRLEARADCDWGIDGPQFAGFFLSLEMSRDPQGCESRSGFELGSWFIGESAFDPVTLRVDPTPEDSDSLWEVRDCEALVVFEDELFYPWHSAYDREIVKPVIYFSIDEFKMPDDSFEFDYTFTFRPMTEIAELELDQEISTVSYQDESWTNFETVYSYLDVDEVRDLELKILDPGKGSRSLGMNLFPLDWPWQERQGTTLEIGDGDFSDKFEVSAGRYLVVFSAASIFNTKSSNEPPKWTLAAASE